MSLRMGLRRALIISLLISLSLSMISCSEEQQIDDLEKRAASAKRHGQQARRGKVPPKWGKRSAPSASVDELIDELSTNALLKEIFKYPSCLEAFAAYERPSKGGKLLQSLLESSDVNGKESGKSAELLSLYDNCLSSLFERISQKIDEEAGQIDSSSEDLLNEKRSGKPFKWG